MVRTVISLTDEDKEWLDQRAQQIGVPMTELVRRAVTLLRAQVRETEPPIAEPLERTQNIWTAGDGLRYQDRIRDEW